MAQGIGIGWRLSASIDGGPALQVDGVLKVDAYQQISALVAGGQSVKVAVAPGNWSTLSLLVIRPSIVVTDGSLTFTFIHPGGVPVVLDTTFSLIGAGALSLLGGGSADLEFTNQGAADVSVDILLGRHATS
jgi:hypothetical protein